MIGIVVGIFGDEAWDVSKRVFHAHRRKQQTHRFRKSTDAVRHARNLLEIYARHGLSNSLYSLQSVARKVAIPVIPMPGKNWVGDLDPSDDSPLRIDNTKRVEFEYDSARIRGLKKLGLKLWDGSILYSINDRELHGSLTVGLCNYFAYVDLGARVFAESASSRGKKPLLLKHLSTFGEALGSGLKPIVVSAAATCVFETVQGPMVALQHRSQNVVNARGLVGVAPIFGLELNTTSGNRSKYGLLTYNFLKEMLEEFFNQKEARRAGDRPQVSDPDSLFATKQGRRLVRELSLGNLKIYVTGAVIDPSDGSLVISLLAHFTSPDYVELLMSTATGSWESESIKSEPKIKLQPLDSPETESLMSIENMIASSIYSLDRARLTLHDLTDVGIQNEAPPA